MNDEVLYPAQHYGLAKRIVKAGGALISPFKEYRIGSRWTFPLRNRLMAGISSATLIIEGTKNSGTRLTQKDTAEFNRDLLAVPGSIFSELSFVPHESLRNGATAITSSEDLLLALGFDINEEGKNKSLFDNKQTNFSSEEKKILEQMTAPITRDNLINELKLPTSYINSLLVELELKGIIGERNGLLCLK